MQCWQFIAEKLFYTTKQYCKTSQMQKNKNKIG